MFLGGMEELNKFSKHRLEIFIYNQRPAPQCDCKLQYYITVLPSFGKFNSSLNKRPAEKNLWFIDRGLSEPDGNLLLFKKKISTFIYNALNILLMPGERGVGLQLHRGFRLCWTSVSHSSMTAGVKNNCLSLENVRGWVKGSQRSHWVCWHATIIPVHKFRFQPCWRLSVSEIWTVDRRLWSVKSLGQGPEKTINDVYNIKLLTHHHELNTKQLACGNVSICTK